MLRLAASAAAAGGGGGEEARRRRQRQKEKTSASRAQGKTSGKFKFFIKKNHAEIFKRTVQVINSKGEHRFFLGIGGWLQDHSVNCPNLFISPGMIPFDFYGASRLPV